MFHHNLRAPHLQQIAIPMDPNIHIIICPEERLRNLFNQNSITK